MGFQLGAIADITNAGKIKGIQREIACDCWFTSGGKTIPRSIKVMGEDGVIYEFDEIRLLFSENKSYSGIQTVEHVCRININGILETVKLVYTKEECKWIILPA